MLDNELEDHADDTEPNRKITQAFIDAMVATVPDGWRLIDYAPCPAGQFRLKQCGNGATSTNFAVTNNCLLVERIPLTGKAWVIENLVARPWSVVRHDGVMYASMPTVDGMKIQTSHRNDYCYWLKGRWLHANDAPISEDISDETVEWLYKADERSETDD